MNGGGSGGVYALGGDLRGAVEHKKALRKTQEISLDIKAEDADASFCPEGESPWWTSFIVALLL